MTYRDNTQLLSEKQVNLVLNHGALGDVITSLPALVRARQSHPNGLNIRVWAPSWQEELLKHLLAPYGEFEILHFEDFPKDWKDRKDWGQGPVALNSCPYNTHTRNRTHMVDYAFHYLLDACPENMEQRSYPTLAPFGERTVHGKYIVFPVGATSDNKLFRASVMAPIMQWALDNGYIPVIVGTKTSFVKAQSADGSIEPIVLRDEVDKLPIDIFQLCVDLREKTTLLQLRDVCAYAQAVVGTDGGTIHLAGTTDTNIIYGLTTTLPQHRYIARHGDPHRKIRYVGPRNLECTGCQSNWILFFHHDFRFCPYGDSICTEKLDAEDFINGLKELGL